MLKLYSTRIYCETGRPSFIAGENWIFRAAAIAFSVKPYGSPLIVRMFVTPPEDEKTICSVTVPVTWFFLASSVYSGDGLDKIRAFCVTSPGLKVLL